MFNWTVLTSQKKTIDDTRETDKHKHASPSMLLLQTLLRFIDLIIFDEKKTIEKDRHWKKEKKMILISHSCQSNECRPYFKSFFLFI